MIGLPSIIHKDWGNLVARQHTSVFCSYSCLNKKAGQSKAGLEKTHFLTGHSICEVAIGMNI